MADVYILTLALSLTIGCALTVALLALSRTERMLGLFSVRGAEERPRWGGTVFLATFTLTPFVASAISGHADDLFSPKSGSFLGFVAATAMVFVIAFLDDLRLVSSWLRSAVFVLAGTAVYAAGYRIEDVGLPVGPDLHLGSAGGYLVTIAWIWVVTNAFNLIDGRDGEALGVAIFAAVTMAVVAGHSDHPTVALLLVTLTGAGLGFLPFNLPPASAYVGDSGANVLGFIIAALSIRAATGPDGAVFLAVPVVALGFPLLDIGLAYTRRMLHGQSPATRDEDHIHHRIEQAGAGPRGLLVIIYGMALVFSLGAIALHYIDSMWMEATVFAAVTATIGFTLARLGYVVTLWNSHGIVWVRQRVFSPERRRSN